MRSTNHTNRHKTECFREVSREFADRAVSDSATWLHTLVQSHRVRYLERAKLSSLP